MTSLKGCADKYFVEIVRNETFDDRSKYGCGWLFITSISDFGFLLPISRSFLKEERSLHAKYKILNNQKLCNLIKIE